VLRAGFVRQNNEGKKIPAFVLVKRWHLIYAFFIVYNETGSRGRATEIESGVLVLLRAPPP
jgi:hypothetical protein